MKAFFRGAGPLILVSIWLLMPHRGAAQPQPDPLQDDWRWVQFTEKDGLPSNRVVALVETINGTMWAWTQEGAAWYDGFRWNRVGTAVGLPEQNISQMREGDEGDVLFVIDGHLYLGNQKQFKHRPIIYRGDTLRVHSAVPLTSGILLVSTGRALFTDQDGQVNPFPLPTGSLEASDLLRLHRAKNGSIWVGRGGYKHRWDGNAWTLWADFGLSLSETDALGILIERAKPDLQGVWVWEPGGPLRRLKETERSIPAHFAISDEGEAIVSLVRGDILVRRNQQWRWLQPVPNPLKQAQNFIYQRNGNLWVISQQGLFLHRKATDRWGRVATEGVPDSVRNANVLLQRKNGDRWIGSTPGLVIVRSNGTVDYIAAIDGTPLGVVTGLAEDNAGGVWVSSGSSFLGAFRWYEDTWQRYGEERGLRDVYIHRIVADRRGRLWFLGLAPVYGGTPEEPEPGAFIYEQGQFTRFGTADGLPSGRVYAFAEGPEGALWFGTTAGLSRLSNNQWTHWTTQQALKPAKVFTLTVDANGRPWFGHQLTRAGLGYIDEADAVHYLTVEDGLINDDVWEVVYGIDQALWIATAGGLSRYQEGIFASFGSAEGVPFSSIWPLLPLDDRVVVGTMGDGAYELSMAEAAHPAPAVNLEDPLVSDRAVTLRWHPSAYQGELPSSRVETRYRIDEGTWSRWSTTHEASVMNMTPGTHTFDVQSKSLFGTVSMTGETGTFAIARPFYQHPLFLGLIGIWIISMAVGGVMYWRKQRSFLEEIAAKNVSLEAKNKEIAASNEALQKNNVKLEAQNAQLERFTYTISHELKTPLVPIKGFLGLLIKDHEAQTTEAVEKDVARIHTAAEQMQQLLHDLLELSRVDYKMNPFEVVALSELVPETVTIVSEVSPLSLQAVTIDIEPEMPVVWGDRFRLQEVFQNLLENAVKFMGKQAEPRIVVGARRDGRFVRCFVQDNGIGVDSRYHTKVFDLFEQLHPQYDGSGVGLALVRRIVEVHGGKIWVESEGEGEGTTFYFTLPAEPMAE